MNNVCEDFGAFQRKAAGEKNCPPNYDDWPEPDPLPALLPTVAPFEIDLLPRRFRRYVEDAARRLSCPADFIGVPLMGYAGAAVSRGLAIRPKKNDTAWIEVPNLWGGIIGEPSAAKSPAQAVARAPLESLDAECRQKSEEVVREHAVQMARYEAADKAVRAAMQETAKKGGDISNLTIPTPPERPKLRRLIINSATVEKVISIHADNPRGLLVYRDELAGWLRGFDKSGRETERAFFLEAFSGTNPFSADTISRGSDYLPQVCISVQGGIQVGPFRAYLQAEEESKKADGLLQRFSLIIWPDKAPFVLDDSTPDTEAHQSVSEVFKRLVDLNEVEPFVGVFDESKGIHVLGFEESAQNAFFLWLQNFMNRLQQEPMPESLQGHLSKYRKALPTLALLLEIIDNPGPTEISLDSWLRAERWGAYLETHARRIYAPRIQPEVRAAHHILAKKRAGKLKDRFTARELKQKNWANLTESQVVEEALQLLVNHHWLRSHSLETGGRPSQEYEFNPREPSKHSNPGGDEEPEPEN